VSHPAVVIEDVSKSFRLYKERNGSLKIAIMRRGRAKYDDFQALSHINLEIPQGSTFGLMGVNGSGKSTLLKCIANILTPDSGTIRTAGKLAALLELGSGFHPELSGRENIYLNGSILGLSKKELDGRFDEIVDFAGVEQFIDQPVKNYSSGMYVRLGFSIAINVDPDILLADEVLAVGDQAFQEKCMTKFVEFKRAGKTVILVSHAMGSLRQMCDDVAWLESGKLVAVGPGAKVIDDYIDSEHGSDDAEVEQSGPGRRWGSGEALITDIALVDKAGGPTTLLHTGDEVTVRLRYETRTPIDDPHFGLTVWTRDGVEVWSQHTVDSELSFPTLDGRGEITFHIPRLLLLPGAYDLSASIIDRTLTRVYDFHRYCYPFTMSAGGPTRDTSGLVRLPGTWSLTPSDARTAALPST
jgi:ABC-type polysaccharide/polyol phosphate transport system ATPase subunit